MTFVFWTLFFFSLWWSISDSCALSLIFLTTFSKTFESDEWWGMWTKVLSQCKERHIQSHLTCCAMFTWPFVKVWVAVLFDYNIGKYLLYWIGDCRLIFILLLFLLTDFLILGCVSKPHMIWLSCCFYINGDSPIRYQLFT